MDKCDRDLEYCIIVHFRPEIRVTIMNEGKLDDRIMVHVNARLKTFKNWPFTDGDSTCTPTRMAEAGFYCCGGENEPDLVRCYFCRKELDGWEPEDDPWKEHASHTRGKCAYVNLGKQPHVSKISRSSSTDLSSSLMRQSSCIQSLNFTLLISGVNSE